MKISFILFLFSSVSFAQISSSSPLENSEAVPSLHKPETSAAEEVVNESSPVKEEMGKIEEVKKSAENSMIRRENSTGTVMVGYQLLTTWLPSKKTASYTHIFNSKWSLEGEYSWGSFGSSSLIGIDLGKVKEKRYALQARRYTGNSFNFTFGAVLSDLDARVGNDIAGPNASASFRAQNVGITGGFGNRWQFHNGITLGVDWLRLNIPIFETKVENDVLKDVVRESDQDDIKHIIRTFNRVPTLVLFGLNLGYTF